MVKITNKQKGSIINVIHWERKYPQAAMAMSRNIEFNMGISINQFIKKQDPIRSGIVTFNDKARLVQTEIPETVSFVLNRLSLGH